MGGVLAHRYGGNGEKFYCVVIDADVGGVLWQPLLGYCFRRR